MARKGLNIYKRKDGRWEARYIKSRNTQGKPRYGYLYATSYHKVRNNLQKVIQALNATDNEKVPATNYKFMGFSAIWLENSSTSLKESTYIRYRTLLNCYLMPSFQQLEISEITSERVCTFCKELEKHGKKDGTGLSPKTISDILSVLRRILHYAQDQNISIDVTAFNIRVKQTPKVMGILSLSEQTTLQEYLVNQLDSLNLGILICLYTGIRVGELCALTWEKISFSDKTICICQTMQRIQKRTSENKKTHIIIAAPKSSSANRVIPIPNTLLKILSQYPMEKTGYFLSGSLSEVVEPRRIQYRFHKILKECGIDRKNFHVLRHTFGLISEKELIVSTASGYQFNPDLHIMTDYQQFDDLIQLASKASSVINRVELLKNAIDLYCGKILSSADGEHWLIQFAAKYHIAYVGTVNELLKQLNALHSYDLLNQYAARSLAIVPENSRGYYWLIHSLKVQGMDELASNEYQLAKQHLTTEEYKELCTSLGDSCE